jgi:uncharacterized protein YdcH (DUF465 family)
LTVNLYIVIPASAGMTKNQNGSINLQTDPLPKLRRFDGLKLATYNLQLATIYVSVTQSFTATGGTMFIESLSLAEEYPQHRAMIQRLKQSDKHFATLLDQYEDVVKEIHRIEEEIETPGDDYIEAKKKERLHLKDHLLHHLDEAA